MATIGSDGFCFEDGKNLIVENVIAHTALHYAFKIRAIESVMVDRCQVTPVEGGFFPVVQMALMSNNLQIL